MRTSLLFLIYVSTDSRETIPQVVTILDTAEDRISAGRKAQSFLEGKFPNKKITKVGNAYYIDSDGYNYLIEIVDKSFNVTFS